MNTVKFFYNNDTFLYYIEKCFCKVVYQDDSYTLLFELYTTGDLDHVEEDSGQNDFPQLQLTIEDFPIESVTLEELIGKTIEIPKSFVEIENEDGELEEVYYTNLESRQNDFELNENIISFYLNHSKTKCIRWKGNAEDFTEHSSEAIAFEVNCELKAEEIEES